MIDFVEAATNTGERCSGARRTRKSQKGPRWRLPRRRRRPQPHGHVVDHSGGLSRFQRLTDKRQGQICRGQAALRTLASDSEEGSRRRTRRRCYVAQQPRRALGGAGRLFFLLVILNSENHHLLAQGLYGQAKPLYERAIDIYEKALGPDHPRVARTLHNLAVVLRFQVSGGLERTNERTNERTAPLAFNSSARLSGGAVRRSQAALRPRAANPKGNLRRTPSRLRFVAPQPRLALAGAGALLLHYDSQMI